MKAVRIYPYGVARNRLQQAAKRFGVPAIIVRDVDEADALVTLRSYYRDRQATVIDAETRGVPIYVLRANTVAQVEQFMGDLFNLPMEGPWRRTAANSTIVRERHRPPSRPCSTASAGWTCRPARRSCAACNTRWRAPRSWSVPLVWQRAAAGM